MAYNLLAVMSNPCPPADWVSVNKIYLNRDAPFEAYPVINSAVGDALAISIPTKSFGRDSWTGTVSVLTEINAVVPLTVYDMYQGQPIDITTYQPDFDA